MDNKKKIADLKADLTTDTIAESNIDSITDSNSDIIADLNTNPNTAETMAAGIPERETIDTIAAPTQSSSLEFETDVCTSEPTVAENQSYSSEALQSTGIPTTQPEETSQASSEYTPRHSSGMMVPVMELENSTTNTKETDHQAVPEVSQTETAETAESTPELPSQSLNPYGYNATTQSEAQYAPQSETGYPEQNETQAPVNNETSVHNETPVNNIVYGPMATESNPYQEDNGYNITSDDWSNMKQQEAKEYMEYDRYKRQKEEDGKPRLHFENMAEEDDDDDDRPRKSGIKKSVIAALAIITITGLGSLFFYSFEAAQRKMRNSKISQCR